ncbi:MAG: hypothetical protein CMK72_00985 [Pseudomonadaceae bacterium]|nr:hypothetical protein [Pseudomonadaceae bacterium]HCP54602.1 hypothetical protein [Pseudomonas sp.]
MFGLTVERLAIWVALVLIVAGMGAWTGWAVSDNHWQAQHSKYVAGVERAAKEASDQARSEEQRRQAAIEGIRKDAQTKIDASAVDATVAGATADRLRAELARIKRASSCSGTASGGEAGTNQTALLADLFEEVERAGRAMAEEAQRRGDSGANCERAFDALTPTP